MEIDEKLNSLLNELGIEEEEEDGNGIESLVISNAKVEKEHEKSASVSSKRNQDSTKPSPSPSYPLNTTSITTTKPALLTVATTNKPGFFKNLSRTLSIRPSSKTHQKKNIALLSSATTLKAQRLDFYRKMIEESMGNQKLKLFNIEYQKRKEEAKEEAKDLLDVFPTADPDLLELLYMQTGRNIDLSVTLHLKHEQSSVSH